VILTVLYNLGMLAIDAAAITWLRRHQGWLAWFVAMGCAGAVAAAGGTLAWPLETHFGVIRLWTYGLFLHGPVLLTGTAVLWRRRRPRLARGAVLAAAGLVAVAADALLVEPHWLEVSHWRIASPKVHRPLRIAVLSDLQTDCIGPYERRVLRQTLDEKPDVILWAGDYLQAPWEQQEAVRRELRDLLREMRFSAPAGMFAVKGNCDPPGWEEMFDGSGATVVTTMRTFDLGDIQLTCLPLSDSANSSLAIANVAPDRFHLVLGHSPNYAMGRIDADLLVAGHTHGGQVRLPWIGSPLTLSRAPNSWSAGLTELPGGGKLLVSRGLGMERGYAPRIRFLCRPELMVIDLAPETKSEP
jgi:uncharacterized protein